MTNSPKKEQEQEYFILDIGTGITKLGLFKEKVPSITEFTCIGYPKYQFQNGPQNELFFGNRTYEFEGPIDRQFLFAEFNEMNFEKIEDFFRFLFKKMKSDTQNQNLLFSYRFDMPYNFIEKLRMFFFQEFKFQTLYSDISEYFTLYFHNLSVATVVDLGYILTRIIPFNQNEPIFSSICSSKMGSAYVNQYLKTLLYSQFKHIHSSLFDNIIEQIKRTKCWCDPKLKENLNNPQFLKKNTEKINMPRFSVPINLGIERILAPEVLFNPILLNSQELSIHQLLIQALKQTHASFRNQLFSDIVICGGGTKFPNFYDTLIQYFQNIPMLSKSRFYISPHPDLCTWQGMQNFISKGVYEKLAIKRK